MFPKLDRYLRATRPGFQHVQANADAQALRIWAYGQLPGIGEVPDLMFVSSSQRRWEYLRSPADPDESALIADCALEDAMLDLQHLMMVKHDGGPALAWMLAADACRHEGAEEPYLLFASSALDFAHKLRSLAALRARRRDDVTRRFLLLHELGHVAVARDLGWTRTVRAVVEAALAQFISHVRGRLETPTSTPKGYRHGSGRPLEVTPEAMLIANFERYIAVGSSNTALVEELCADWIAAIGLAQLGPAIFAEEGTEHVRQGSWRKAADGLFLAARLVRLLGFLTGIRQLARALGGRAKPYWSQTCQVEFSIRLNVIMNLAATFNETVLSRKRFAEGSGFPAETTHEQTIRAFNASIARDGRTFHERVFSLNAVIEPALDPARLAADLAHPATAGLRAVPLAAADAMRTQLDLQLAR